MRTRYVYRDGEWVDAALARPLHESRDAPMIRPDGMDPIVSMADGKTYDSRSAYYADLKARGSEIVGNDRAAFDKKPEFVSRNVEQSIKQTLAQYGMGD